MIEKIVSGECLSCESTYSIQYYQELTSEEYPEHCPFCGEMIEELVEELDEDEEDYDDESWD
jgi:NAD-dependent SIR2 family protein deacetylase